MSLATSANGTIECVPCNTCPLIMRAKRTRHERSVQARLRNIRYFVLYAGHLTRT